MRKALEFIQKLVFEFQHLQKRKPDKPVLEFKKKGQNIIKQSKDIYTYSKHVQFVQYLWNFRNVI